MAGLAALYGQGPQNRLKELYLTDPRYQAAQQSAQWALSGAPAQGGWGEALARVFGGFTAGRQMNAAKEAARVEQANSQQALTDALSLGRERPAETKTYGDGTKIDWEARPANQEAMMRELYANPETAPIGMGIQGAMMEAQIANQAKANEPITPYQQAQLDKKDNGITIGPDGTIQIGGSGKLTERQGKATSFAARMNNAEKDIEALTAKTPDIGANSLTQSILADAVTEGGITGKIANYGLKPEQRELVTAQNQWVNGLLRLDSGATLKPEEYSLYRQQYFPQAGDGPEVIAQKARAREIAKQGTEIEAGPGDALMKAKQEAVVKQGGGLNQVGANASKQSQMAPKPIADKAAFDALPSGTQFVAPDGSVRVKP